MLFTPSHRFNTTNRPGKVLVWEELPTPASTGKSVKTMIGCFFLLVWSRVGLLWEGQRLLKPQRSFKFSFIHFHRKHSSGRKLLNLTDIVIVVDFPDFSSNFSGISPAVWSEMRLVGTLLRSVVWIFGCSVFFSYGLWIKNCGFVCLFVFRMVFCLLCVFISFFSAVVFLFIIWPFGDLSNKNMYSHYFYLSFLLWRLFFFLLSDPTVFIREILICYCRRDQEVIRGLEE